jgi:hypothetical protein
MESRNDSEYWALVSALALWFATAFGCSSDTSAPSPKPASGGSGGAIGSGGKTGLGGTGAGGSQVPDPVVPVETRKVESKTGRWSTTGRVTLAQPTPLVAPSEAAGR